MSRRLNLGGIGFGAGAPVRVESMLSHPLSDLDACRAQLDCLAELGAELVRVALPDRTGTPLLRKLCRTSPVPLMADLHFDPALILEALDAGVPSLRLNPGNMGDPARLERLIAATKEAGVVVRVGANGGSLSPAQLAQAGGDRALALAEAVSAQVETLLAHGQSQLIISAKCTDLQVSLRANQLLKKRWPDFVYHIGITEAGWGADGLIKSAAGIGALLMAGIGDTIRISLSGPPEEEVKAGYSLLRALDLRHKGGRLIACPTCGRKKLDTARLAPLLQDLLPQLPDGFTLAVMGCEVNGPGEARDADLGIAGTPTGLVVFAKGRIVGRYTLEDALSTLKKFAQTISGNR